MREMEKHGGVSMLTFYKAIRIDRMNFSVYGYPILNLNQGREAVYVRS